MSFDNIALLRKMGHRIERQITRKSSGYASDRGLNYVGLDGNIGNIGAGLMLRWI